MLDFDQIVPRAAKESKDRPVLAAPYPMPEVLCRRFVADGIVSSFVANKRPQTGEVQPAIGGWWIDRPRGAWFIRPSVVETMILLGGDTGTNIGARMLLEARLKGIRRILLVAADGSIASDVDVGSALIARVESVAIEKPVHQLNYDDFFEEMFALVGNRLRLPKAAFAATRILLVTGSLDPGGAERQVAYTAAGLARSHSEQIYLGRAYANPERDFFKPIVEGTGVHLSAMPEHSFEFDSSEIREIRSQLMSKYAALGVGGIFYMIFHHALMIRKLRPRLVHTWQDFSNVLGGIAATLVGVPRLVLSGRSLAPDNWALFQPYMAPAYRAMRKRRELSFLNNSQAGALDYARWLNLPRECFAVVHNGFEFPTVSPATRHAVRKELNVPDDAVVVGSILRFSEEKQPGLFMEIARLLHSTYPKVRFVVFGAGPLLETCRTYIAANGLESIVQLPGLTTDAWGALAAMDIFVLTSRLEGLPNVMVEAQAMGLPVVCIGRGGMSETFVEGVTGYSAASGSAEDLARRIARLLDDAGRRCRMSLHARQHARKFFGLDRMIDATLEAYQSTPEHQNEFAELSDLSGSSFRGSILLGAVTKQEGGCFMASLPPGRDCSELMLWEDDRPLNPKGNTEPEGAGLFSIEDGRIRFSTSDGSDPRFNGRSYRLLPRSAIREVEDLPIRPDSISAEIDNCYITEISADSGSLRLGLWEDNKRLGPGGCLHDDIRLRGQGRYSVWGEKLYFSSSDNADPRSNGRSYFLRKTEALVDPTETGRVLTGISLDQALQHLTERSVPAANFTPGRVVHVVGSLGPGGAERQILYTLAGLQKATESVQLLCYYLGVTRTERHDFYLPEFVAAGVPVRTIRRRVGWEEFDSMPRPLREVAQSLPPGLAADIADLYWEFLELRPEVVHAWLDWTNERVGLAAGLAGVPRIILSGRNMNPTHFPFHESYMGPAYRALLELPQVTMLNNSRAGRNDYADWLGIDQNRIHVLYNGVDFGAREREQAGAAELARQSFGLRKDAFVVGGIFRFAPEKRPLLWIETAAEIARRIPSAQFILFGRGELLSEINEAVARFGLGNRLVIAGLTSDVINVLSMMDVVLFTSAVEGVPNVILEAGWVGTPVVATQAGGASEAVLEGVTGWIVNSPTSLALADRVSWIHDHPEVRVSAQIRGPAFVREKFSVQRMIKETLAVYGIKVS